MTHTTVDFCDDMSSCSLECDICLGRRGSDSSIETKSGATSMLGGTTDSVGERLGRDGGHGLHGDAGHGGGGGGLGGGDGEEEEAACHSLPVQVTRSVQIGKIGL